MQQIPLQDAFELDFLPVGSGERSGDAIAMRYRINGVQRVMVYDGGTQTSGEQLVGLIRTHYGTNRVDHVVNSHPDADHASGLSVVLEEMDIGQLWMHRPWTYSASICDYFHDGRITDISLATRLQQKMAAAYALERIARRRNVPIYEPFQRAQIGPFYVLSPARDFYIHELVPRFEKSPETKEGLFASTGILGRAMQQVKEAAASWIPAQWNVEILAGGETSAENESSTIIVGEVAGVCFMLCGDAGVGALSQAAAYAESRGVSLPAVLDVIQLPHHGSRRNVSSGILDRILGPRRPLPDVPPPKPKIGLVSASATSTTHPRRSVLNAFKRRGVDVYGPPQPLSSSLLWYKNYPPRAGYTYGHLVPNPFFDREESA